MKSAGVEVANLKVTAGSAVPQHRCIPNEVPDALVYDGTSYAVMMASPSDLEDFAIGFSLTEGVVSRPEEINGIDIVEQPLGIELRMWLAADRTRALADRRRRIAGPTGCGLCGIESLEAAAPQCPRVTSPFVATAADVRAALASLPPAQALNHLTHAVHAAAFWAPGCDLVAIREDVGRHNALDKLIGALHRMGTDAATGMLVLTSRVSVEMVQKAAVVGVPIIVAVSAPTALALTTAEAAGITLVAVARADAFEIFTHTRRIEGLTTDANGRNTTVGHAA
jgi:FdhD protein